MWLVSCQLYVATWRMCGALFTLVLMPATHAEDVDEDEEWEEKRTTRSQLVHKTLAQQQADFIYNMV